MDSSFSAPAIGSDDSDEPQTPPRSPSRLDFCIQDLEDVQDPETYGMDWACVPFRDDCPYTFIDEETFEVDVLPLDHPRFPIVERGEDDSPHAVDAHSPEQTDSPSPSPILPERPMNQAVTEPKAPTPVRPISVQFQFDTQEDAPTPRTASQRLNYPHHGFSRSALLQQKTLWNSRHEKWLEWQSRIGQSGSEKAEARTDDAYTGLATSRSRVLKSPPPYMRSPPSGLERDLAEQPPRNYEQDVHASIYPRVGDISALRDPYSVNIDRCFFRYPLWTLRKTLYVFNMHQRAAPPASADSTAHIQASTSSSSLSSYASSADGDQESDATLVAEDSPTPQGRESILLPHSPPSWNRFCSWELSWYARWELLIGLFQRDSAMHGTLDISMTLAPPPEHKAAPPPPSGRVFRFTIGDGGDDDDGEDGDYGTLVSDSSFSGDFDEECERAMAFYSRESTCSVMVL